MQSWGVEEVTEVIMSRSVKKKNNIKRNNVKQRRARITCGGWRGQCSAHYLTTLKKLHKLRNELHVKREGVGKELSFAI
jgi:hypothetical protein